VIKEVDDRSKKGKLRELKKAVHCKKTVLPLAL
jgi:hypothetical protein